MPKELETWLGEYRENYYVYLALCAKAALEGLSIPERRLQVQLLNWFQRQRRNHSKKQLRLAQGFSEVGFPPALGSFTKSRK